MELRQALAKILAEWPSAQQNPFRDNALANFIRSEFPKVIEKILGPQSADYLINGSPGAGNWASVPWLSILDKEVTHTTTSGFYPVFLFRADMSGVFLSLIQGTTSIRQHHGNREAARLMDSFNNEARSAVFELSSWSPSIELKSNTALGRSYEPANIGAKFYPADALPDNSVIEADLLELLSIYRKVKTKLGTINMNEFKRDSAAIPKPFLLLAGISGTGKTKWVRDQEEPGVGNLERGFGLLCGWGVK